MQDKNPKSSPAYEKKREEVAQGAAQLPHQEIGDEDDDEVIREKQTLREFDSYNCMVHCGADGLNHVPKRGIPAAEVMLLQYINGSTAIKDIKLLKKKSSVKTHNLQVYLRDYLAQRYGEAKIETLWGSGFTEKELPLTLTDPARSGAQADQMRSKIPDDGINGKRIA